MSSLNCIKFGEEIKKIRISRGFTQKKVYHMTGINVETLRRIENGITIPRYSTLDLLSKCYRKNIYELLKICSSNRQHNEFIKQLDEYIISGDSKALNDISKNYLQKIESDSNISLETQFLKIIIEGTSHHRKEETNYEEVVSNLVKSFTNLRGNDFNISNLKDYIFFPIEIRILLVIANFYMNLKKLEDAINILDYCLSYLLNEDLKSIETHKLVVKIYYTLSYCYHLSGKDEDVINISNDCLKFIISNDLIFMLDFVYFRKGIAEYFLKLDYRPSLSKSITINKINSEFKPTCNFEEVLLKKYGITLDK